MIATRRRPFRLPIMAFVQIVGFFGLIYVLVRVPLTHKLIFDGPLKPMWAQANTLEQKYLAPSLNPILEPLSTLNLTRKLTARNSEIIALKKELQSAKSQNQAEKKSFDALQKQLHSKRDTVSTSQAAAAAPAAAGSASSVSSTGTPMVQITPSPDETQTATYWGSMEAENAAAIAQKLDPVETARIFLAMKPDQVAEIMNVLPADYNVKLQAVHLSYPKPVGFGP